MSRKTTAPKTSEHLEQAKFFRCARIYSRQDARWQAIFAIPNAGKRSYSAAAWYKAEGLTPGVPDIFVAVGFREFHGLFIEMKLKGTAALTVEQEAMGAILRSMGYLVAVCRSADEAVETVKEYFRGTYAN